MRMNSKQLLSKWILVNFLCHWICIKWNSLSIIYKNIFAIEANYNCLLCLPEKNEISISEDLHLIQIYLYLLSLGVSIIDLTRRVKPIWSESNSIRHDPKINGLGMSLFFWPESGRVGFGSIWPDLINYIFWSNFII
jgi:hypothetical protein